MDPEQENYDVDPNRAAAFYQRIRDYLPRLPDGALVPDYAGIRPKLTGQGEPAADFLIDGPRAARRAAAGPSVRDRIARADLCAVDRRGGGRRSG